MSDLLSVVNLRSLLAAPMYPLGVIALFLCLSLTAVSCQSSSTTRSGSVVQRRDATPRAALGKEFDANDPAPDFSLPSLDQAPEAEPVALSSFRGKTVLLNYWATWCAPCVAEMPSLERLYQTYKDDGFVVVSIAVDQPGPVKKFVEQNGLTFPVLLDPDGTTPPDFGITGFPESFFIAPDGRFIAFLDPSTAKRQVRIISDRAWDSKVYLKAIKSVLEKTAG